ncbi:hypothetical protein [Nocardia sp. NPDC051832]|uniref:hypothetical protein n=1 Tax=Nocardia sp. NPDC051832 TaxID=3155673 RepID=UPI003426CB6A
MTIGGHTRLRRATPTWWYVWMGISTAGVALSLAAMMWNQAGEGDPADWVVRAMFLVAAGVLWFVFGIVGLVSYRAFVATLITPIMVVGWALITWSGVHEKVAWRISKGALERAAATCQEKGPGSKQRIGIYTITHVNKTKDGCEFTTEAGFLDRVGFAYYPGSAPQNTSTRGEYSSSTSYTHHYGPWYRFTSTSSW